MTSATVSATARTYAYNGDGLLQSRTQGTATTFLWDTSSSPSRLLQQGSDRLVYGLGPLWVVKADGSTSSFARDGGKSVRAEVNGSGAVTASFRYRAYGAVSQSSGASTPSYIGYAGQLQDPSGLLYMRARWYDPNVGRFTTKDPVDGQMPRSQVLNVYIYGLDNPMSYSDPMGLMASDDDSSGCEDLNACSAPAGSPLTVQGGSMTITANAFHVQGSISLSIVGTPDGQHAVLLTPALGPTTSSSRSVNVGAGPVISNARQTSDYGQWFGNVGSSESLPVRRVAIGGQVDVASGRTGDGYRVWVVSPQLTVGTLSGAGTAAYGAASYTWSVAGW